MSPVAIFFVILGSLVALSDWRKGMLVCIVAGFVQDPLRKLTPGEPIYLTVLVGIVFAVTSLAALRCGVFRLRGIREWRSSLRVPVSVFIALVIVQALHTQARFGSPILALIGVLAYLAPLPALPSGFHFARTTREVRKFLRSYGMVCLLATAGVFLGFSGLDWPVLRQVGPGIVISGYGGNLEAQAGFLRSPEVAAWHAGTAACFLIILAASAPRSRFRWGTGFLVVFLLGAVLLTGRRKMLMEFVLFLSIYWFFLAYFRRGARKVAALALVAGVVATAVVVGLSEQPVRGPSLNPYLERGATAFGEAPERVESLGLGSVVWAIRRHGFLGAGAGTGSQGAQHFGGGTELVGGAAEGGLGKIVLELGIPGLLVLLWTAVAVHQQVWRSMVRLSKDKTSLATLHYGLVAFLGANAVTFVVASQVYGDLFVLLLLGWNLGFVFSISRMANRSRKRPPSLLARAISHSTGSPALLPAGSPGPEGSKE